VKGKTERRMLRRIRELRKNIGNRKLVVAGCMPTLQSDLISKVAPDSLLFGTYEYDNIPDALIDDEHQDTLTPVYPMHRPGIGIIPLSTGCLGECAYCIVRLIKGELHSYPPEQIIGEVEIFKERGAHEVWLTSQDLANYGIDRGNRMLPWLLASIMEVAGGMKIRLGMMNPANVIPMLDSLIEVYEDPRIYKFAHIPVQSGSDRVLSKMGRPYSSEDWRDIVKALRSRFPRFTISTDIIVGFPSENEDDFHSTLSLIEEVGPDIVNLSRYEHRPGTPASRMKSLQGSEVKRRSREASRVISRITRNANEDWVGWRGGVLVSEVGSRGGHVGRNDFYKPIILGEEVEIGSTVNATITGANENYLIGYMETEN
jgi:MiaB-like tRNA modifying enzyme